MKGIGHFLTGIAVTSCFPEAMRATVQDSSMILMLGGAFGLLADTIDFRICSYFWKRDHELTPDLDDPDPRPIAELIARAIDQAAREGREVNVKLHTLKVSAGYHRTYWVHVDGERKVVQAGIGPLKNMGQVMGGGGFLPRTSPPGAEMVEVPFEADVVGTHYRRSWIAIFAGPDFGFKPEPDGKVRMEFIPWHRVWAHSPALGLLCGFAGLMLYGSWSSLLSGDVSGFFSPLAVTALIAMTLAFWGHIFVDQFGRMGSVLLWPFSMKRASGFGWTTAANPLANITLNYICLAIILFNCIVHTPEAGITLPWAESMSRGFGDPAYFLVSLANFAVYFVALPLAVFHVGIRLFRRFFPAPQPPSEDENLAEGADAPGELGSV